MTYNLYLLTRTDIESKNKNPYDKTHSAVVSAKDEQGAYAVMENNYRDKKDIDEFWTLDRTDIDIIMIGVASSNVVHDTVIHEFYM
jgi:hypothetical protein